MVKLQVLDLNKKEIKIKIISAGAAHPLVGGSKLKFYLGDKSESSKGKFCEVKTFIINSISIKGVHIDF